MAFNNIRRAIVGKAILRDCKKFWISFIKILLTRLCSDGELRKKAVHQVFYHIKNSACCSAGKKEKRTLFFFHLFLLLVFLITLFQDYWQCFHSRISNVIFKLFFSILKGFKAEAGSVR